MENNQEITNQTQGSQKPLPNSSTVLVLGIVSIVLCWCHGIIGLILAIIAFIYDDNRITFLGIKFRNVSMGYD
jgi:cytoskeletal protein RodZ